MVYLSFYLGLLQQLSELCYDFRFRGPTYILTFPKDFMFQNAIVNGIAFLIPFLSCLFQIHRHKIDC